MSFKLKRNNVDHYSKSMPPNEFNFFVTSSDSGIDSDTSPNSSTKLAASIEKIEKLEEEACANCGEETVVDPTAYLLGPRHTEAERTNGISNALQWLRTELESMKLKDRELAKTMIKVRSDIAAFKVELEKGDTGYDSDSECVGTNSATNPPVQDDGFVKENWKLVTSDPAFPSDGSYFENNKRATWVL